MSRAVLNSPEDFLFHEPYKSIINILMIAPSFSDDYKDDMPVDVLKCLIIKDYSTPERHSELREFLIKNLADRVTLNQDIKPIKYNLKNKKKTDDKTKKNKETTTVHHLFYEYLKRLENVGWIIRDTDNNCCSLSEKYKILTLKEWHKELINSSKMNSIFAVHDFVFYFANNFFDIKHSYLSNEDFAKLSKICEELSTKFLEIDIIFKQVGIKKAASKYNKFLEKIPFHTEALKEIFYIYLIADVAAGLGMVDYKHATKKEKKADPFDFLDKQMSFINLNKIATEQYIVNKYKMTKENYYDLLDTYNYSYYELHILLINSIHGFAVSHMSYTILGERPYPFSGKDKPRSILGYNSISNLVQYKKFIQKSKKKKTDDKSDDEGCLRALFDKLNRNEKVMDKVKSAVYANLPETSNKQNKSSFFKDNNFLDGFEVDLKELEMTIVEAYEKLDEVATLFNKY
jgi:hypothetical protein